MNIEVPHISRQVEKDIRSIQAFRRDFLKAREKFEQDNFLDLEWTSWEVATLRFNVPNPRYANSFEEMKNNERYLDRLEELKEKTLLDNQEQLALVIDHGDRLKKYGGPDGVLPFIDAVILKNKGLSVRDREDLALWEKLNSEFSTEMIRLYHEAKYDYREPKSIRIGFKGCDGYDGEDPNFTVTKLGKRWEEHLLNMARKVNSICVIQLRYDLSDVVVSRYGGVVKSVTLPQLGLTILRRGSGIFMTFANNYARFKLTGKPKQSAGRLLAKVQGH